MSPNFYVTTAIYYANAQPHIGHAYEAIGADVIARFQRLIGKNVFFLTGTDEHGIKVEKTAAKNNMPPKDYVDSVAESFRQNWKDLDIDFSRFIRTTAPDHYDMVAKLWRRLLEKGDIYKAKYQGLYCSGCETFCLERDLTPEGLCPHHLVPPEPVEEENYFFRLSQYKDLILEHFTANPEFILPAFRRNEVLNQLDDLEDISVSRSKRSVSWGIPVPDDPEQTIYVWIDALGNYLTGLSALDDPNHFEAFWPPDVQVIGKDILRFHALYWPAMLLAAELQLPKTLLVHGFITVSDTKISKSIGNVISTQDLVERFALDNPDPIRYYMMSTTNFGQDGNYTDEEFKNRINADLANNLGNLLNRTLNMLHKYCDGLVPVPDNEMKPLSQPHDWQKIRESYETYQFSDALQSLMTVVDHANKSVNDEQPWTLHKEGQFQKLANVLYSVLEALRQVAIGLSPVMPTLSQRIWEQLGYTSLLSAVNWSAILETHLPPHQQTQVGQPILPRLESEIVGAGKKK